MLLCVQSVGSNGRKRRWGSLTIGAGEGRRFGEGLEETSEIYPVHSTVRLEMGYGYGGSAKASS